MNEAEYLMKNYGDRGGCYDTFADMVLVVLYSVYMQRFVLVPRAGIFLVLGYS